MTNDELIEAVETATDLLRAAIADDNSPAADRISNVIDELVTIATYIPYNRTDP